MTDAYLLVGDAIYSFVDGIDITSVYDEGWLKKFARPFKPEEVTAADYPAFVVIPAEDEASTLDTHADSDRITYWVTIMAQMQDTIINGEGQIRALADLVRNAIRAERGNPTPFGLTNAYDLTVSGTWGWKVDRAERFYRIVVSVQVAQDF
jgi:hypothetical protein